MYSGKKAQYDFPKMRGGGGAKAVWNFSKNSSVLVWPPFPKDIKIMMPVALTLMWRGLMVLVFSCPAQLPAISIS